MSLDFYLSEMAVSDEHGGGLTLQRVLGEDLDRIGFFFHVSRFGVHRPAVSRLKPRCLDLFSPLESDAVRRKLGCRPADWLGERNLLRVWQGRRVARAVNTRFSGRNRPLRALVCPQNVASLFAMDELLRLRPVDYISWVMDDHLIRWQNGAWHYPPGMESLYARHLKGAKRVFVISPAMAEFYRQRFGVDSTVLFGPANALEGSSQTTAEAKREIRLAYFGAVESWQLDSLALLAENLAQAGAVLDIYSGRNALPPELQRPGVSLKGRIPAAQVPETMRTYDAVVLPISFRPELRHMSEFNIATKMSECLASGTITLVIGPAYAAMVRFLAPHRAACLTTTSDSEGLRLAMANLKSEKYRREILAAARELVRSELSTHVMGGRWQAAASNWAA